MEEVTNELLVKIYAAHLGCDVSHTCDLAPFKLLGIGFYQAELIKQRPILYGDWSGGTNPETACAGHTSFNHCRLLLRPLSSISDEDAIEVAKMLEKASQADWLGSNDLIQTIKDFTQMIVGNFEPEMEDYGSFFEDYDTADFAMGKLNIAAIIDYLRSKSYDLGFGPIPSLITAGIAIDSTKSA